MSSFANLRFVAFLVVAAVFPAVGASSEEDNLRTWIAQANGSNRTQRAEAIWRLGELGPEMPPEAFSALIRTMNVESFLGGSRASMAVRSLGAGIVPRLLDTLHETQDEETRMCIVKALGAVGPPAKAAVNPLIAILRDKSLVQPHHETEPRPFNGVRGIREEAAAALVSIAGQVPAATDAFLAVMADEQDNTNVRSKCAWSLGRIRPTRDGVVPALILTTRSEGSVKVRGHAIKALAAIGPPADAATELLISILNDKSLDDATFEYEPVMFPFVSGLREESAAALGSIAGDAKVATDRLLAVLADQQDRSQVRGKCAESLGRLHPPADKVVPTLILAVQSQDANVGFWAATALNKYSPEEECVLDALLAALESPHAILRRVALDGIAKFCPKAKRAKPPLLKAIRDSEPEVREKAIRALSTFGPEIAVPPLVEAFKRGCKEAGNELQRLGRPAASALVELLRDPDPLMRARVAETLAQFDYLAADALPTLREVCQDSDPAVRRMAVRALGFIGVASSEVMESLCQSLKDQNTGVRRQAASSLYCLVQQATPPTSVVLSALQEKDSGTLKWLISTVGVGKMADERLLPLLLKHLDHPNRDVRSSAVLALRVFGTTASAAVPRLMELAPEGSDWEKMHTLRTLAEIGTSRHQAEQLLAQDIQEGEMAEAMLHLLVPHPDLAERFLSEHPEVVSHLRVETAQLLGQNRGAEFAKLKQAIFDHPDLPAEVILESRDPKFIPTLKRQMESVHPHRRSYLAAVARALGKPPDRIVKISESEPGDFRPGGPGRIGDFTEGHGDGFSKVLVTGRIVLDDGTPAPPPQFFEGNDRMLMGKTRREPAPVDYDPDTGRFVFRTTVFAAYSLGPERRLGPYMTGPAVVIIEAARCRPLEVMFWDEMPDVEITLARKTDAE